MPAPRINSDEIKKLYFTRSEAMEVLHCPRHWLEYHAKKLGITSSGFHRYSVAEINMLMADRARPNNGLQALIAHIEIDPVTLRERDVYASKRKEWLEYRQAGGELSFDEWLLMPKKFAQ